ncbi:MAG: hypothetical protein K6A23_06055 [Butyrivibrio sp.]|nr:hypothetical protein [Butyrivibrio sp.]
MSIKEIQLTNELAANEGLSYGLYTSGVRREEEDSDYRTYAPNTTWWQKTKAVSTSKPRATIKIR